MKKNFEEPVVEIITIEDVITDEIPDISGGGGVL